VFGNPLVQRKAGAFACSSRDRADSLAALKPAFCDALINDRKLRRCQGLVPKTVKGFASREALPLARALGKWGASEPCGRGTEPVYFTIELGMNARQPAQSALFGHLCCPAERGRSIQNVLYSESTVNVYTHVVPSLLSHNLKFINAVVTQKTREQSPVGRGDSIRSKPFERIESPRISTSTLPVSGGTVQVGYHPIIPSVL